MSVRERIRWILFAICGLAILQPGFAAAGQNQSLAAPERAQAGQTLKIAGTVVNAITGEPLSQARITIAETKERAKSISMITSENGHFEFSQVKPGKYSLQGAKRGFISSAYEQHEQFSTAIVTGPEFPTENLILRLTPMALITGHVFDEFGDPVRKARVFLFLEDHRGGMTRITRLMNSLSDDRGYYDFSLLRPGKYYVSVSAKPWYAMHPTAAPDTSDGPAQQISAALDVAYPTTYYHDATEAESATPIEVNGGDRLQIDMHLNPTPALHLLFRVPQEQQQNFSMPVLQKHVFESVEFLQSEGMHPVAPGVYEMTGVPPGRYNVREKNANSGQLEQSSDVDLVRNGQELNDTHSEPLSSLKLSVKNPGEGGFRRSAFVDRC